MGYSSDMVAFLRNLPDIKVTLADAIGGYYRSIMRIILCIQDLHAKVYNMLLNRKMKRYVAVIGPSNWD